MPRYLLAALLLFTSALHAQTFGSSNAGRIRGRNVDPTAPTNSQILVWSCVIPSVVFTGAGLNDASSGGTCTANTASLYEVVIDSSAASPDTFKWRKDGGSWTTGVSMTGAPQTLADGVTITFKATDGHTLNNAWAIATTVSWTPKSGVQQIGCPVGSPDGSALSTGVLCYRVVPQACTITSWDILVDSGTATLGIWKVASGTAIPTASNSIVASAAPAISTGTAIHSTTMTGWTTSVAQFDIFGFNLTTTSGPKFVYVGVNCAQ